MKTRFLNPLESAFHLVTLSLLVVKANNALELTNAQLSEIVRIILPLYCANNLQVLKIYQEEKKVASKC